VVEAVLSSKVFDVRRLQGKLVDCWPYHEPIFPAETLPKMWEWMQEDRLLHRVFYEHGNAMTFPEMVRYFDQRLSPDRLLLLFTTKAGEGAGFGWYDQVKQGLRATANVCMRRKYWGPHAHEAAQIALEYIFGAFNVQTVFGLTPVANRMALAQAKRLGFKAIARIPKLVAFNGTPMDVIMTHLTRERWEEANG
jgi:RimJ/RimL family protein N-acetyltransferase